MNRTTGRGGQLPLPGSEDKMNYCTRDMTVRGKSKPKPKKRAKVKKD